MSVCSNDDIKASLDDLSGHVQTLTHTVYDMGERTEAFMQSSRIDREQLNQRVAGLEHGRLSLDSVKGAVSAALTEHGVVTQQSLPGVAWRLFAGSAKRLFATMALASAGIGGGAALVSAVIHWIN